MILKHANLYQRVFLLIINLNFYYLIIKIDMKIGNQIKVRVLTKDSENKNIYLTIKPILMKETNILTEKT